MNDLELSLRDSMVRGAERAPHGSGTLAYEVETLYRRRWRRRRALIAAAAAIVAGIAAGVPWLGPVTTAAQHVTAVEPIEQVWPQAVKKAPAGAVRGNLIAMLDDHTLLVDNWSPSKLDYLYTYDLDTGETREIAHRVRRGRPQPRPASWWAMVTSCGGTSLRSGWSWRACRSPAASSASSPPSTAGAWTATGTVTRSGRES
ncbi:hypothetical protein ACFQ0B_76625 [Nonomuraea thailandensis]